MNATACAASPAPKARKITDIAARDAVVRYLDSSPRALQLLRQRLAVLGPEEAYTRTVRDALSDLPSGQEAVVGAEVRRVFQSRFACPPRHIIRRVRRARSLA